MALISYTKGSDNGGGGWQPLPEGTYDLTIRSAEAKTSKAGNPQIQLTCEVADGEYAGKRATVWYSLLPNSTWKLDRLIDALGIGRQPTGEFDAAGKEILAFDVDHLVGRVVRYNVKQREYQGKVNNDFADEARSPLDEAAPVATTTALRPVQAAPVTQAAPEPQQLNLPETARRRPRPAGPA